MAGRGVGSTESTNQIAPCAPSKTTATMTMTTTTTRDDDDDDDDDDEQPFSLFTGGGP